LAIVVGVAARGSLWGWNKRHALVESYRWVSSLVYCYWWQMKEFVREVVN
jgi:hypothetical protein